MQKLSYRVWLCGSLWIQWNKANYPVLTFQFFQTVFALEWHTSEECIEENALDQAQVAYLNKSIRLIIHRDIKPSYFIVAPYIACVWRKLKIMRYDGSLNLFTYRQLGKQLVLNCVSSPFAYYWKFVEIKISEFGIINLKKDSWNKNR